MPGIEQPDLVAVGKKVPSGIICLLSALCFHNITVQIPHWVDIAIRQSYHPPVIDYPPVQFHWFSNAVFDSGVEEYDVGGVTVKIYSPEKSIVDCFRLRNKVGVSIALEALKTYWRQGRANLDLLRHFAEESRVLRVVTPYIRSTIDEQS